MLRYNWKDKAVVQEVENRDANPSSSWRMGKKRKPTSSTFRKTAHIIILEDKQRGTTSLPILWKLLTKNARFMLW